MSFYSQPNYYQSLLGISSIDNVNSNTINTNNVNTQNLTVSSLQSGIVSSNPAGVIFNAVLTPNLTFNSNILDTVQNIQTTSSPTFLSLTLSGLGNGIVKSSSGLLSTGSTTTDDLPEGKTNFYYTDSRARNALSGGTGINYNSTSGVISNSGVLSLTGTTNRVTVSGSTGNITLSGPQDIGVTSSPTFNSVIGTVSFMCPSVTNCILCSDVGGNFLNAYMGASMTYNTGTRYLNTVQGITTGSSPTFAGLTIGSLSGVLKASSGVISGSSTTSNLPEGSNLYYTDSRARLSLSAGNGISYNNTSGIISNSGVVGLVGGSNITITPGLSGSYTIDAVFSGVSSLTGTANQVIVSSSTGAVTLSTPQDIATTSSPTFLRILNSSKNSSNVLIGTFSGASLTTGGGNTLIGQASGNNITSGTFNIGLGANSFGGSGAMTATLAGNIAIGVSSLFSCTGNAANNTAIGYLALQSLTTGVGNIAMGNSCANNLLTGNNNVYIGQAITSSTTSVSSEGAINLTGSGITGKGTNTFFINATSGLYSYIPFSYNLWNNNAGVVSHVEQWVANTAGGSNVGTAPTITSGVITGLAPGRYNFAVSGFLFVVSQTCYPTLQYRASGGSFVTVCNSAAAFTPASFVAICLNANVVISSTSDAIQLYYPNTALYGNTGTDPSYYTPAGNYVSRYMTINYLSL